MGMTSQPLRSSRFSSSLAAIGNHSFWSGLRGTYRVSVLWAGCWPGPVVFMASSSGVTVPR